jgi:hypothetical protein
VGWRAVEGVWVQWTGEKCNAGEGGVTEEGGLPGT